MVESLLALGFNSNIQVMLMQKPSPIYVCSRLNYNLLWAHLLLRYQNRMPIGRQCRMILQDVEQVPCFMLEKSKYTAKDANLRVNILSRVEVLKVRV
jgi:hypothetical protein